MSSNIEELKGLVVQTLQSSGVLGRIKSQLRASVFDVLQGKDRGEIFLENKKLQQLQNTDAMLGLAIIKEFLEFYDLEYTKNVFEQEISISQLKNRDEVQSELESKKKTKMTRDKPLLLQLLQTASSPVTSSNNPSSISLLSTVSKSEQPKQSEPEKLKLTSLSGLPNPLTKPKATVSTKDLSFDDLDETDELEEVLSKTVEKRKMEEPVKEKKLQKKQVGKQEENKLTNTSTSSLTSLPKSNPLLEKKSTSVTNSANNSAKVSPTKLEEDFDDYEDYAGLDWRKNNNNVEDKKHEMLSEEEEEEIEEEILSDLGNHSFNEFSDHTVHDSDHYDHVENVDDSEYDL